MTSTTTAVPWFESLTDSVYALGETAREFQRAHQAARLATASVDIGRVRIHKGRALRLSVQGNGQGSYTPHGHALSTLGRLYMDLEHRVENEYKRTALAYACGAVWAVRQILTDGGTPSFVLPPDDLAAMPGLDRYAGAPALAAARDTLDRCLDAGRYGEELAERDYLADHEASDMHDAWRVAGGLANAAYAYGLLGERAVHFALLGPKNDHAKDRAAARAAEQQGA